MPRPSPRRSRGTAAPRLADSDLAQSHALTGDALTLRQAAAFIARSTGCRRPHLNTVFRWATKGVRGHRLHTFRVGRNHWTTRADIADFLRRLNGPAPSPAAAKVVRRQHDQHARSITAALAAELGVPVEEFS